MAMVFESKEMGKAMGSDSLQLISEYLQQAKEQQNTLKYVLLSGHDTTLLSIMSAMEAPLDVMPAYADHLSFALYETEDHQYNVVVTYNDKPVAIPGCQRTACTFDAFKNILQKN